MGGTVYYNNTARFSGRPARDAKGVGRSETIAMSDCTIRKEKPLMGEEILLTKEGYAKLKAEYEELVSVTRKEVAERLKEARAFGDLSENAEYDAAKNEQSEVEARILKLEQMLRQAKIMDDSDYEEGVVNAGSSVTVFDKNAGVEKVYTILGASESDPFNGIISNVSPIGKGLLKHKVGDEVEIETPAGKVTLEIRKIQMYTAGKED